MTPLPPMLTIFGRFVGDSSGVCTALGIHAPQIPARRVIVRLGLALLCGMLAMSVQVGAAEEAATETESPPASAEHLQFYSEQVEPILREHCFKCHGGETKILGGLVLMRRADVLAGGDSGPAVDLESPTSSLLWDAVNYSGLEMPPTGKLEQAKLDVLKKWIELGLPMVDGEPAGTADGDHAGPPEVNDETRQFWSFQPVQNPAPPAVQNTAWVRNPIDAFVLNRLESAGLHPAAPLNKVALLRRVYFDLTGLPPTPTEVAAFVADESPDAYAKVVDELLASPHYGERWGRHWLDLVRYAETNSFERDAPKPNAWRYRDYVIDSFNQDKPYFQFVREQLAGDELAEVTRESIIATGYYRLGQWDDEPSDPLQAFYDEMDDIVATTSQVFLGLTVNCARCHDHKLDPIPQTDYYRMLAFFHDLQSYGTRGDQISWNQTDLSSPEIREIHHQHETRLKELTAQMTALEQQAILKMPGEDQRKTETDQRQAVLDARLKDFLEGADWDRYSALKTERQKLQETPLPPREAALSVNHSLATPRDTFLMIRGSPHALGEKVEPGFPLVLGAPDPTFAPPSPEAHSSGRRRVLANWIASASNPLTARVIVNRVWQSYFGRGIVRSSSNFGLQGDLPTHPELLDWLATQFLQDETRFKKLHRLIVTSNTYQMSAQADASAIAADPQNNLFWRTEMRRLSAEEIRDAILCVTGQLNPTIGGPSVYPRLPDEVLAGQSVPGTGWGKADAAQESRRSVYIHLKRSLIPPMLSSFDFPDSDASCPIRFSTTQPTQALSMLNGEILHRQSRAFAERVRDEAGTQPADQVRTALSLALARPIEDHEVTRGVEFMRQLIETDGCTVERALDFYCLLVLNLNEFVYLD